MTPEQTTSPSEPRLFDSGRFALPHGVPPPPAYSWRVIDEGRRTNLILHLARTDDTEDGHLAGRIIQIARRHGIELEPVFPGDLNVDELPPAA